MSGQVAVLVSNISPKVKENELKELFECCGNVLEMHHDSTAGTYTFTYSELSQAKGALMLTDTPLGDQPIVVTLIESAPKDTNKTSSSGQKDMSEVMAKVRAATQKLGAKVHSSSRDQERERRRSRDRSRERRRKKSSRSRSRDRRRSRSRSRGRRSRSSSPPKCYNCGGTGHISRQCPNPRSRSKSPSAIQRKRMRMPDRAGMIFNGYKWESMQNHSGITQTTGGLQPVTAVQLLQHALLAKQQQKE